MSEREVQQDICARGFGQARAHMPFTMHTCSAGMAIHAFLAGRHLWQTKNALYLCCGMALSFSRAPAAQQSVCPHIQGDKMNGCHDNTGCSPPHLPRLKSANVAVVFAPQSLLLCHRVLKSKLNDIVQYYMMCLIVITFRWSLEAGI